jgi:hypothetical protein
MKTTTFPDITIHTRGMRLEDLLSAQVTENTLLGLGIRHFLNEKKANYLGDIITGVMDAYNHRPEAAISVVGPEAMDLIKELYAKLKK